jgi:hypothetical protein
MNIQRANCEDLLTAYYHGTRAHVAAKHLRRLIGRNQHLALATLLRDHRERGRGIDLPREINMRAATDRLMNCYSVMEIASEAGAIPDLRRTDFGKEARLILEDRRVRRYYEEFYPTRLPKLFRHRLTAPRGTVAAPVNRKAVAIFMEFADLDRRFMENLEDEVLLRMLDSFRIDGYWFSDVVQIIGKPKVFIEHLLCDPAERDARSWALQEFSIFMQFCFDLHKLLSRTADHPVLQSMIWNHYSYWFDIIGAALREQLGDALAKFLDWAPPAKDRQASETIQTYVHQARDVLKILTSQKYAGPIERLSRDVA